MCDSIKHEWADFYGITWDKVTSLRITASCFVIYIFLFHIYGKNNCLLWSHCKPFLFISNGNYHFCPNNDWILMRFRSIHCADGRQKYCSFGCYKLQDTFSQWYTNHNLWSRCDSPWEWRRFQPLNCCCKGLYYLELLSAIYAETFVANGCLYLCR